ncbi:MAG: hypothetical protein KBT41_01005, partial [bacterium]|nr:hypothetical protein [Candidatus Colousia faecequi]
MASSSLAEGMFVIQKGGKLVINGTEEYSVIIDGGANYQTPINYNNGFLDKASLLVYASDTHRSMKKPAIRNFGTLTMEYVTVRNVYNSCGSDATSAQKAGAVLHAGTSGTVKTTLTNCVVERCKSPLGSGLFMCSESVGTVTLTDCEFRDCVSTETKGATSTGTIRSFGDTETSLNMYRVKVHHCYANLSGGGVYINAAGASTTMATISGCEIYNNYSEVHGGGFNGGGNFQFTDTYGQNLIHNNHAGEVGGGIHFYAYSGGKAPSSAVNVKEIVDSSVEVYGNDAPNGAGIAFTSNNEISLPKNSTYSLSIEGADIHDNVATNNGGGVYYDNGYTGSKYSFSAIIKTGSNIHKNEAGGDGGGLYMNKAPITIEGGTIQYNTSQNGAGLYVQNGDVQIGLAEVSSNTAEGDGGGFYVNGGNVTISDGLISGNSSVSGGGVYVNDGNFTFTNGNVDGNTATLNGGGAYVSGGDVTFKGNFSGNTAANGGGLYLGPGASMEFQGGLIINNEATMPDGAT